MHTFEDFFLLFLYSSKLFKISSYKIMLKVAQLKAFLMQLKALSLVFIGFSIDF